MSNLQETLTTTAGISKDLIGSLSELAETIAEIPGAKVTAWTASEASDAFFSKIATTSVWFASIGF